MAEQVRGLDALKNELVRAKDGLKDFDKTIAKLTGRDANDPRPAVGRGRGGGEFRGRGRLFNIARRGLTEDDTGPPAKRRASGGAFSRLGPVPGLLAGRLGPRNRYENREEEDDDWDPTEQRPAVQSSIVATPKDVRSRDDLADNQNPDEKSKTRNRRMFGVLMGTLQKFQKDEKQKTDKEHKRKVVEERLEHKAREEKDRLRKDKQDLFRKRKQQELKIKLLEQKMELVRIHEEWEKQTLCLGNFIRTKTKPHVYYLPKDHTGTSERRLKETKKILEEAILERKKHLEEEIEELTSQAGEEMPRPSPKVPLSRRGRQISGDNTLEDISVHRSVAMIEDGEGEEGEGEEGEGEEGESEGKKVLEAMGPTVEETGENGDGRSPRASEGEEEGNIVEGNGMEHKSEGPGDSRRFVTTDSPGAGGEESRDSVQSEIKEEIKEEVIDKDDVTEDKRAVVVTDTVGGDIKEEVDTSRRRSSDESQRTVIHAETMEED